MWYLLTPGGEPEGPWVGAVGIHAGTGVAGWIDGPPYEARFSEPFGIVALDDGTLVVSDAGDSHRIRRIAPDGTVTTVAGGGPGFVDGRGAAARFRTPSAIAMGPDGALYVADTGNNAIRRVTLDGEVTTVAGDGIAGDADGPVRDARFNAPVGVTVDGAGRIVVADTYNDRIRMILPGDRVLTIAGEGAGHVDGARSIARFDTPCGVAVDPDGRILVADTGNGAVRVIGTDGSTSTHAASFSDAGATPSRPVVGLDRPIAVAADADGNVHVADEAGTLFLLPARGGALTIGGSGSGFANGVGGDARFRRPSGLAVAPGAPVRLFVADAGNALVRGVTPVHADGRQAPVRPIERLLDPPVFGVPRAAHVAPAFDAEAFGRTPLIWPVAPLDGPHEVAGTFGEARGDAGQERFHAGLDVREVQGTVVRAVREGIVSSPIATGSFDTLNEWVRIGPVAYVHIRVGRRQPGRAYRVTGTALGGRGAVRADSIARDAQRFAPVFDETGAMQRMRVKRGAAFAAGDVVGTINGFNHVHLNVGWPGEEHNPLRFGLVRFVDTIAPTIAAHGVRLFDESGQPLNPDRIVAGAPTRRGRAARPRQLPPVEPVVVRGRVQIVVDTWDQAEGNTPSRRLGLYALGYQVLDRHGVAVPGFEVERRTIRFDSLGRDADAPRLVFASGSGIPVHGARRTRFLYVVTTTFVGGVAVPGHWDTTTLAPGEYVLRVFGEDHHGNRTTRDLRVVVTREAGRAAGPRDGRDVR